MENTKYKKTDIGYIPEDWNLIAMGDFSKTEGGYAFKSSKFLSNGKYQVVKMSNVYGGKLDLNRSGSFLNEIDKLEENYILKKNEILITLTGTVGKKDYGYTYLIQDEKNLLLNQRVGRIILDTTIIPAYIFYQIKTPIFTTQFFELSKGGTGNQTNVGTKDIDKIFIPLPSTLAEQQAIAEALSDADAMISSLEKLIAKKKLIKQGMMQKLLTPKEGWVKKRLGELVKITSGESPSKYKFVSSGIPYYKVEQLNNSRKYQIDTPYFIESGNTIPKGSIVFPKRGASILLNKVRILKEDSLIDTNLMTLTLSGELNSEFIFYLLTYIELWRIADTTSIPQINNKHIYPIELFLPSIDEQTHIAITLSDLDSEIARLEYKLNKSIKLRQGMMQVLLTGKKRLI